MPSPVDTKLMPELYEVFLSYKRATTKVEIWLAVTSNRDRAKIRLTIFEMQQAAQYIKSNRIEVPDLIYYRFDRAITARSEVTSHFRGFFATSTTEAMNASHETFTKTLKAIFKSLCPNQPLSSLAKATSSSSTPLSNFFETLSSLPPESDAPTTSVDFHDTRDARLTRGVGAVEAFFAMAQQLDRPTFKLDHATGIGIAGNAIRETFKGRNFDDLLWDL